MISLQSVASMTVRQHWAAIAQGMQQDVLAYAELRGLLCTQFHAALRHDAAGMAQVAISITALVDRLNGSREVRTLHAEALLPNSKQLSMSTLFATLQAPLQQQLQSLWTQLEASVQECQFFNQRNCELIMGQAELMRTVIAGHAQPDIYAPL